MRENVDTRTRILAAATELFRSQGMTGTGLKQIATTARAPFGSIYHFFPGGKGQLTDEVIRSYGVMYGDLVYQVIDSCPDLPTAVEVAFAHAQENLAALDYTDGCPVATIALEVASNDEALRVATADVFADWIARGTDRVVAMGFPDDVARRLIIGFITSLEGSFVLARSLRSPEPIAVAGRTVLAAVREAVVECEAANSEPPD